MNGIFIDNQINCVDYCAAYNALNETVNYLRSKCLSSTRT